MADGIDALIGDIKNAHVEPKIADDEEALEKHEETPAPNKIDTTDARGSAFDPSKHATDESGAPLYTPKGRFRKKPRSEIGGGDSSGGDQSAFRNGPRLNIPGQAAGNPVDLDDTAQCAALAAAAYIQIGVALFGPEWQPIREMREQENLTKAFNDYFEAKDITDFPPGIALAIAMGGYAAIRLHQPVTQNRIGMYWQWARLKIGGLIWRNRYNASRNDNRADRVRENDASQTHSGEGARGWRSMFGIRP